MTFGKVCYMKGIDGAEKKRKVNNFDTTMSQSLTSLSQLQFAYSITFVGRSHAILSRSLSHSFVSLINNFTYEHLVYHGLANLLHFDFSLTIYVVVKPIPCR